MDQVVGRVLEQERDPSGSSDLARGSGASARPRGAAASTCRRRCGPSARRARPGSIDSDDAAKDGRTAVDLMPYPGRARRALSSARRRDSRRRASPEAPAATLRICPSGSSPRDRRLERAAFTPATGASARDRAEARAGGGELGAESHAQARNSAGAPRRTPRARRASRSPGPRSPGTARAGARPITIAASKSSLSRRSSAISSSPATGSSCEVGSSSRISCGLAGQRRRRALRAGARHRRARRSGGRAACAIPSASDASSTARATAAGASPPVLQRERQLGADRAHHDLRLGVLEQRADRDRERPRRPVLARVHAGRPWRGRANTPPWKCGTSPLAARSSVDLPEPDPPASTTSSPGAISSDTSSIAGAAAPG